MWRPCVYGGWGGIRYAHIADTYIALFIHFLTCGTWEGLYIIDGLMRNQSTIQPKILHADTQGQTTTVFAMVYLLGIQLLPRIRHWKDLVFYRPNKDVTYRNIELLFKDTIDGPLIETHWQDLMRVVLSIKTGPGAADPLLVVLHLESPAAGRDHAGDQ